jgi:hypothetical protein
MEITPPLIKIIKKRKKIKGKVSKNSKKTNPHYKNRQLISKNSLRVKKL